MLLYRGDENRGEIQSEQLSYSETCEPVCEGEAVAVPPEEPFKKEHRKVFFFMHFYCGERTVGEIQSEQLS